jgi:hypothetical protein
LKRAAVGVAHPRRVAQHLHVGAQRRHRRAQLVRRVCDELALLGLRGLQAREHRVEARGHAPDLVVAARVDAPAEVAGGLDVLGRVGQLGHRGDHAPREQPAHARGERGAGGHERHEHCSQALEDMIGIRERARHLHGADRSQRRDEDPQVQAVDVVVGEAAAGLAGGGRERVAGDRERRAAGGTELDRVAVGPHELGVAAGAAQAGRRRALAREPGRRAPAGAGGEALVEGGVAAQGIVDLAALLSADGRVGDERRQDERDADDHRRHQRQPRAQRHGQPSRRT